MNIYNKVFSMLPQNKISNIAGKMANSKTSKHLIKPFAKYYKIDLNTAEKEVEQYKSLQEFFTRRLKDGARRIDTGTNTIVSPVDGVIAQFGEIKNGTLIQAKGINYELSKLIPNEIYKVFENGLYMTIYLSPSDYHRVHMPFNGEIFAYERVPGRLFPVNNYGVNNVKGLFTKNERVTSFIETDGESIAAVVEVGAFIVGSCQVAYKQNIQKNNPNNYEFGQVNSTKINKGKELGWFEFGSTIILLMDNKTGTFLHDLIVGQKVKMGQRIGTLN